MNVYPWKFAFGFCYGPSSSIVFRISFVLKMGLIIYNKKSGQYSSINLDGYEIKVCFAIQHDMRNKDRL
jgi:hypothetical protein